MALITTIKVDDIIYDESKISSMYSLNLKTLISFIETERDLNCIKA